MDYIKDNSSDNNSDGGNSDNSGNDDISQLIKHFSKLPGIGKVTSRRLVLYMLQNRDKMIRPMITYCQNLLDNVKQCTNCGNYDNQEICYICRDDNRLDDVICLVEGIEDLWAIERTQAYKGKYHILGGLLSAMQGVSPEDINIYSLINKVETNNVTEIILALSSTFDGQSTSFFISDKLKNNNVKITQLASGIPIGGELDYLDDSTLHEALKYRKIFDKTNN